MVLTKKTTSQTTGFPGNDLKQSIEGAGNKQTMLIIQSPVSTSGTAGLNIQSQ